MIDGNRKSLYKWVNCAGDIESWTIIIIVFYRRKVHESLCGGLPLMKLDKEINNETLMRLSLVKTLLTLFFKYLELHCAGL